jgi:L-ribulose-5-phosphate 4-epimerase
MSDAAPARQQIVEAALRLSDRGFLVATGGNLSVRIPGQDAFAITPTNLDYRRMAADDVVVLDGRLRAIAGDRKPSVESSLHAAVYRARRDVNAIVHTHQANASALSLIDAGATSRSGWRCGASTGPIPPIAPSTTGGSPPSSRSTGGCEASTGT